MSINNSKLLTDLFLQEKWGIIWNEKMHPEQVTTEQVLVPPQRTAALFCDCEQLWATHSGPAGKHSWANPRLTKDCGLNWGAQIFQFQTADFIYSNFLTIKRTGL